MSGHDDEHLPVARELIEAYAAGELEDPSLISQIESSAQAMELVGRIHEDNDFLTQLAGAWSDADESYRPGPPSQSIEGYRILSEIHRGGQGVIYKAVQEHTKRTVAVKVMIGGALASARQRLRFEREVELVASLRHSNIVTVFDSGTLSDGGHYLAMEYIKGVPLSRAHLFGREEPLDDVELFQLRVDQFAQICDAIQFAHQRGIIHRDLKPGNILVDRNGVPKVFDFGVAKVMGVLDKAEATLTGEFVGTFAYASPEQVKGDPSEVDTRSDVYALGLILYELLTEQHPYPVRGAVSEVIQNITSTEAEPPSRYDTRIGRDLEAIVLKAIEKEPGDRYQSAAALADDLRRWMVGEPVEALRDNPSYLLRKVARKYRVPILLGTAGVAVLLMISILMSVLWYRTARAEHMAEVRLEQAQKEAHMRGEVTTMFTDIIESLQPQQGYGEELTVRDMVDQAARIAGQQAGGEPEVEAALLEAVGNTMLALGDAAESERHLAESLRLRLDSLGDESEATGDSYYSLAYLALVRGELDDALQNFRRSLDIRTSTRGPMHEDTAFAVHGLGLVHERLGDADAAREQFNRSLQIRLASPDVDPKSLTQSEISLARLHRRDRKYDEAERLYLRSLARLRPNGDESSPMIATLLNNLAVVEMSLERRDEAGEHYRESLEMRRRFYPEDHIEIGKALLNYGNMLHGSGDSLEAEPHLREAVGIYMSQLGDGHIELAKASQMHGKALLALDQHRAAHDAYRLAHQICVEQLGEDDWRTADVGVGLGQALTGLGRHDEAGPLLQRGYRVLVDTRGSSHATVIKCMGGLEAHAMAIGDEDQAHLWRERIRRAHDENDPANP